MSSVSIVVFLSEPWCSPVKGRKKHTLDIWKFLLSCHRCLQQLRLEREGKDIDRLCWLQQEERHITMAGCARTVLCFVCKRSRCADVIHSLEMSFWTKTESQCAVKTQVVWKTRFCLWNWAYVTCAEGSRWLIWGLSVFAENCSEFDMYIISAAKVRPSLLYLVWRMSFMSTHLTSYKMKWLSYIALGSFTVVQLANVLFFCVLRFQHAGEDCSCSEC